MTSIVIWDIGVDGPIRPDEPMPPIPRIPKGALVVVGGRAPVWRYGIAFHMLHGSPAGAVATYDPRIGAVVVATHSPDYREGEVIHMEWFDED